MIVPRSVSAELSNDDIRARQHYDRGRELEDDGDLAGALVEYEQAQSLRPVFRLERHLGRVCRGLGRYLDALNHYRAFLEEGGELVPEERRAAVLSILAELREQLATVRLTAPEGAEVIINGEVVGRAPLSEPLVVDPGELITEVRLEGHRPFRNALTLVRGQIHEMTIYLEPLPREEPSEPPVVEEPLPPPPVENPEPSDGSPRRAAFDRGWFWSGVGVSSALLVTGAVFGVLTLVELDEFESVNRSNRSDEDDELLRESQRRGEAFGVVADVLLFSGAAFAVATVIVGLFTDFEGEDDEASASISWLIGAGGVGLRGNF